MPALALGQVTATCQAASHGVVFEADKKGMHMNTAQQEADEIVEEFSFFDDWADRYQHLIDQGRRLKPMEAALQTEENQLKGCQSVVYFSADCDDGGRVHFSAASDAAIVQGLIALLLRVYSARPAQEILALSPDFLEKIGLDKHLSPTRKNGLASMVEAIKNAAQKNIAQ
jgi:cysteine desulfuration protein SufE